MSMMIDDINSLAQGLKLNKHCFSWSSIEAVMLYIALDCTPFLLHRMFAVANILVNPDVGLNRVRWSSYLIESNFKTKTKYCGYPLKLRFWCQICSLNLQCDHQISAYTRFSSTKNDLLAGANSRGRKFIQITLFSCWNKSLPAK